MEKVITGILGIIAFIGLIMIGAEAPTARAQVSISVTGLFLFGGSLLAIARMHRKRW